MNKRIPMAVLCNMDPAANGTPITGALCTYMEALLAGGALPFIIPMTTDSDLLDSYLDMAGGVLIPGGIDVYPRLYNEPLNPNIGRLDPDLDLFQIEAMKRARARNMPMLGICRGEQVMNVAFGGSLIQHIGDDKNCCRHNSQPVNGRWPVHDAVSAEGSKVRELFGERFGVNSFHHQAVKDVAPGFKITARSDDGIVEAIEAEDGAYCVAVQWHPERMYRDFESALNLFKSLTEAAAMYLSAK